MRFGECTYCFLPRSFLPRSFSQHRCAEGVRKSGLHVSVKAGFVLCGSLLTSLEECQQVGVNRFGLGGRHTVRKVLVAFECTVPQQLCRQWSGRDVWHDLIVFTM